MGLIKFDLIRKFFSLSYGSKLLIGSFVFNIGLMSGALALEFNRRKKVSEHYQLALIENQSESFDNTTNRKKSSCFLEAKLFKENCSYMLPDAIMDDETCSSLEKNLAECHDQLYSLITIEKTPSMQPITGIINLPSWINPEPLEFSKTKGSTINLDKKGTPDKINSLI